MAELRAVTAANRYDQLSSAREGPLRRARDCAALTIPSIMPPEGYDGSTELPQPFQSVGADGANNLSAKMLMSLFPPGESFVRLVIDEFLLEELVEQAGGGEKGKSAKTAIETGLGKIERGLTNHIEQSGARQVNFEALQHLVICGNGLIYVDDDGREKFFPLSQYVLKRDLAGNVLDIVVKECISRMALPLEIQEILSRQPDELEKTNDEDDVELYTWVQRQPNGSWKVHQEVEGEIVPGSEGTYPKGKSAWIPLRWTRVSGSDYGRGRCEEYYGDLQSLETATQAIVRYAAIASKVVFLVNEGGVTQRQALVEAESGDVVAGDANDVSVLMVEKDRDFAIVANVANDCKARLERAFLLATSVQRQAERVTAEEIRAMIGELESSHGGVYSILAEEWQRHLAARLMHQLQKKKKLPTLPEGVVSPQIVTGLAGLGRNADMQKLDVFLSGVAQVFGPEALQKWINIGDYMQRRAAALGIDTEGLVISQEEVQAADQQAQMAEFVKQGIGPGIKATSDYALAQQQAGPQPEVQ